MAKEIIQSKTPEQEELEKKRSELEALVQEIAQEELNLVTLENNLNLFEGKYLRAVGVLYSQLDEIHAEVAENRAKKNPQNAGFKSQAKKARKKAEQSSNEASETQDQIQSAHFKPTKEIKDLYRKLAKLVHPDLASDEKDRDRRTRFMAEVNSAYRSGDINRLEKLLYEWENSPEAMRGDETGADLVRVIRKIALIKQRLEALRAKIRDIKASEIYKLKIIVEVAAKEGKDLLAEMAANLRRKIKAVKKSRPI